MKPPSTFDLIRVSWLFWAALIALFGLAFLAVYLRCWAYRGRHPVQRYTDIDAVGRDE